MAHKIVRSVQAAGPGGGPCGRPFSELLVSTGGSPLPATLNVTFDDASVLPLPITWLFSDYDPFDNIGKVCKIKGKVVLPAKIGADTYDNPNQVDVTFTYTTTAKTGKLDPLPGAEDVFCNRPGQPAGS